MLKIHGHRPQKPVTAAYRDYKITQNIFNTIYIKNSNGRILFKIRAYAKRTPEQLIFLAKQYDGQASVKEYLDFWSGQMLK